MNLIAMSPPGIASFEIATWASFVLGSTSLLLSMIAGTLSAKAATSFTLALTRIAGGLATVALLSAAIVFISTMLRVLMTPHYLSHHGGFGGSAQWVFDVFSPIGFLLLLALNAWILAANRLKQTTISSGDP